MSNIFKLDDNLLSQAKKPSTIGATHVSLASSECIEFQTDLPKLDLFVTQDN